MDYVDKLLSSVSKGAEQVWTFVKKWGTFAVVVAMLWYLSRRAWFWFGMPLLAHRALVVMANVAGWGWVDKVSTLDAMCVWVLFFGLLSKMFVEKSK